MPTILTKWERKPRKQCLSLMYTYGILKLSLNELGHFGFHLASKFFVEEEIMSLPLFFILPKVLIGLDL